MTEFSRDVRLTALNSNPIDVVHAVDKEELVVEGELVVALVLWLLDVSRVLLHVLHIVLGELNDEVDDVILTKQIVQIDREFLRDRKSVIDLVVVGPCRCR